MSMDLVPVQRTETLVTQVSRHIEALVDESRQDIPPQWSWEERPDDAFDGDVVATSHLVRDEEFNNVSSVTVSLILGRSGIAGYRVTDPFRGTFSWRPDTTDIADVRYAATGRDDKLSDKEKRKYAGAALASILVARPYDPATHSITTTSENLGSNLEVLRTQLLPKAKKR